MALALEEARRAAAHGDVPIGAVLVRDGDVVASACNEREHGADPTAHAEILVLRAAARAAGAWRLSGSTVYVTLEPCPMCAGALVLARVDRVVYGAPDPKSGAAYSLYNIVQDPRLNHQLEVREGVRAEESAELLRSFFSSRRAGRDSYT